MVRVVPFLNYGVVSPEGPVGSKDEREQSYRAAAGLSLLKSPGPCSAQVHPKEEEKQMLGEGMVTQRGGCPWGLHFILTTGPAGFPLGHVFLRP